MDIEALLDPRGGDGYADGINSGVLGILGLAADRGLVSKIYSRPYLRDQRRHLTKARTSFVRSSIRSGPHWTTTPQYEPAFESVKGKGQPNAVAGRRPVFTGKAVQRRAPQAMREWKSSSERTEARRQFKAKKAGLKTFNKTIKIAGWGFILDGLFSIGQMMTTPGISATTVKKDMMALADESPFDSARAATGRQRALQAIHDSQMTVRNVVGSEASFLHK